MDKISMCLWFDGFAEDAAHFYTSLFPNSRDLMLELFASSDRDAADRAMQAMLNMRRIDIAELERAAAVEVVPAR